MCTKKSSWKGTIWENVKVLQQKSTIGEKYKNHKQNWYHFRAKKFGNKSGSICRKIGPIIRKKLKISQKSTIGEKYKNHKQNWYHFRAKKFGNKSGSICRKIVPIIRKKLNLPKIKPPIADFLYPHECDVIASLQVSNPICSIHMIDVQYNSITYTYTQSSEGECSIRQTKLGNH